jgi:hypothetical protein
MRVEGEIDDVDKHQVEIVEAREDATVALQAPS